MQTRPLIGALVVAMLAVLTLAMPAAARGRRAHNADVAGYIDPFAGGGWLAARTDMGVDYMPVRPEPVLALGDAVILGADRHAGWPGGRYIWYQLLDGSHAGEVVYVAEHLRHLLPAGTRVRAGQQIAVALPGYPWTEWGWGQPDGETRAFGCYHEGQQTNSGKEMARFLQSLGAPVFDAPGPGPDWPTGKAC